MNIQLVRAGGVGLLRYPHGLPNPSISYVCVHGSPRRDDVGAGVSSEQEKQCQKGASLSVQVISREVELDMKPRGSQGGPNNKSTEGKV